MQLAVSGSPTPVAVITAASFSSDRPTTLAFDHDGSLWVALYGNSSVNKIENPETLTGSVVASVAVEVDVASFDNAFPALWPPPPGLPIRTP